MFIDENKISFFSKDLQNKYHGMSSNVDIVLECTGLFTTKKKQRTS